MIRDKIYSLIRLAVVIAVLSAGVSYAATAKWTPPPEPFPNGNADAPINTGTTGQTKAGSIWSKASLGTDGGGYFGLDVNIATGRSIRSAGRLHIQSAENLYLNPWSTTGKVIVGGGGGNGNLEAKGSLQIGGSASFATNLASIGTDGRASLRGVSIKGSDGSEVAKIGSAGLGSFKTLQVTTDAGAGKVLTSDASGNATWKTPSSAPDTLKVGQSYQVTLKSAGSAQKIISIGANHKFCALTSTNLYSYKESRAYCSVYYENGDWKMKALWSATDATSNPNNVVADCIAQCLD